MKKILKATSTLVLLGVGVTAGWQLMQYVRPGGAAGNLPGKTAADKLSPAAAKPAAAKTPAAKTPAAAPAGIAPLAAAPGQSGQRNEVALKQPAKPTVASGVHAAGESAPALPPIPPAPGTPAAVKNAVPDKAQAPAANLTAVYRQADQLIHARNFAAARELLQKNLIPGKNPANAVTLYRLGLAGRYGENEKEAQAAWSRAHEEYPLTPAGRMSAIALADTWYAWYAGKNPQFSEWEKIRNLYSDALGMDGARFLDPAAEARIAQRLNRLNDKLVFSPDMKVQGAQFHTVRSGENLTAIARRYNLDTWRSLVSINHINPSTLRVGDRLKILPGRVFILVNKRNFTLSWYLDGVFIRRYPCAVGAAVSETPAGRYKIVRMDVNPDWRDPKTGKTYKFGEPGHAIGSRWMAMEGEGTNGLGIHGTIDPGSMGKKASNGCVRLLKDNVEELYGFVSIQHGNETEVLIIE